MPNEQLTEQTTLADRCQLVADWLREHPDAEQYIMQAQCGRRETEIVFYDRGEQWFRRTFAGHDADQVHDEHGGRLNLNSGGIRFLCWLPGPWQEQRVVTVTL